MIAFRHTLILLPARQRVCKLIMSLIPSIVSIPLFAKLRVTRLCNFDTPYIRNNWFLTIES